MTKQKVPLGYYKFSELKAPKFFKAVNFPTTFKEGCRFSECQAVRFPKKAEGSKNSEFCRVDKKSPETENYDFFLQGCKNSEFSHSFCTAILMHIFGFKGVCKHCFLQ